MAIYRIRGNFKRNLKFKDTVGHLNKLKMKYRD
jgi:hypothetical protein